MRTELISIETDTLPLDGAFHRPDGEATAGAVLLFHRNSAVLRLIRPGAGASTRNML
jgi:hypothetical protein